MKKVLITAFEPFYKSNNNYSKEVLNYINLNNAHLDKKILDVVYDECFEMLSKTDLSQYNLIVALGEARSRQTLTVEKQAKNIASCSIEDNKGNIKQNEIIDKTKSETLETLLDLNIVKGFADISYDAGKFVCNDLYFHLLSYDNSKCLFIHVPECYNDELLYKKYALDIQNIIETLLK